MKHTILRAGLIAALLIAVVGPPVFAQGGSTASSIIGTVTDASGAVIPGASVVVKNNATATEFTATTNEQGGFTIPAVDPGSYTVTVTLMGFKTWVAKDVRVNAATPASVRATLEVGGLEETVTVAGGSEIIQTQSAAVTSTINTSQILKLPTGSRSALEFVTSLPGVSTPGGSRDSTINGLPQSAINITIDGISAQDNHLKTGDGFFARVSPRLDAMEEVTVSSAAQDAANTGQGAVQIRFVTRSGSNNYTGSSYFYLRHYTLDANSWFNNRNGVPKNEDILYQPGTRVGGPIVIPGLWNGRNKGFFFVNYEESRSPGQNTENRTVLHPRAEQGIFRWTAGGQTREVNLLDLAARSGHVATVDPTMARLFADIRNAVSGGPLRDLTDPLLQEFTYQYDRRNVTRYPTGRLDFNLTDRHRLSGSLNYTDLLSTPDTTNNREPNFPGFPGTGNQHSDRYTMQSTLRSTLTQNLVNEFKVGGSGGATRFSPEIGPAQFQGTPVADQGGFFLDINGDFLGITNPHSTASTSAREATTRIAENTLSWLKGTHNVQAGFAFTQADVWLENQQHVPIVTFGVSSNDPAQSMFSAANFPGASTAQLNDARELYATLTGRVIGIAGELRLDEKTDEYRYLGLGVQRARLRDYGFFVADTWRWRPNFTLNLGLRYELQSPFYPMNNSYSKATLEDVCGLSGVSQQGGCNIFQPGNMPGRTPQFVQFNKGEGAYKWDRNNFAPSIGFAWTVGGQNGLLRAILGGEEGDSVLRAGYTLAYNRPGTSDFTGTIDDNPGISLSANRNHTLGNLGSPGSVFLRNRADLGPPPFPTTRQYPMTDVVTGDIMTFDQNLQVPYSQTWTAGWQRKLTRDMAIEARYVGTRSLQSWQTYDYNEINIVENGFLDEFRLAQQNLRANLAANRGATFRYFGPGTGTSPLPIFLAYFTGRPASAAGSAANYTGTLWTSSTFVNPLAMHNPQPITAANALDADATRRGNALRAGLPANFLVANPDYLGGAELVGNGGYTKYNSFQLELRKRLSQGLQFNASYVFGPQYSSSRFSLRTPRVTTLDTGTEGTVAHAFKANWTYELPFGQGRRFGASAGPVLDRIIGGWSFDGIARIQSGRTLSLSGVRLIGMTERELQNMFKLRFDHAGKLVWMLPQDVIDNTVRAFSVSATSATGYSDLGAPEGRYIAPENGTDCIAVVTGDCGLTQVHVTGPTLYRFDLSAVKRLPIRGRVNFEFRAEFLNAFNTPWFTPVFPASSNPDAYRVTGASGAREIQLVWRLNW
ncbi:MAG TPA: TonB-dependent receptor [Vicinamibacterales bacterium]|nr:TonB-dependent receptor [Vicinamibacterales bacterium]